MHFRHAERDKWIDVQKYDALESHVHNNGPNNTRFAEEDYFANAVCLNSRGKIQAKSYWRTYQKSKTSYWFCDIKSYLQIKTNSCNSFWRV